MPIVGYSRASSAFDPLTLSPTLWLDAADAATITSSGGLVSQWSDKSGGGHHATQGVDANKPSTGLATENGRNVISFLTSAAKMSFSRPSLSTITRTLFVVQRTTDTLYMILSGGDGGFNFSYIGQSGSSSTLINGAASTAFYKNGASVSWANRGAVFTALDNQCAVVTEKATWSGNWEATWNINGYTGVEFTGALCEILLYHSLLSDSDRSSVESYLRAKWGTP